MRSVLNIVLFMSGLCVISSFAPTLKSPRTVTSVERHMFSGAGAAAPKEDDEQKVKDMERMASAMGMSVEEYQLGINARTRMEESIKSLRVSGGDTSKGVTVERDGNSPPQHLVITVTEEGKALGKEGLEKELVAALKAASEQSKKGREKAQAEMMQYIGEQMKTMGG